MTKDTHIRKEEGEVHDEWKPTPRACSVCGKTKPLDRWYERCTPECEAIETANIKKLIEENNRLEAERRAKPATIGDIEDAIKSLRESFSGL